MNQIKRERDALEKMGKEPKEILTWTVQIPKCCREGWASCPHVVQRLKAKKGNVGL